jgi:hypothetical protein
MTVHDQNQMHGCRWIPKSRRLLKKLTYLKRLLRNISYLCLHDLYYLAADLLVGFRQSSEINRSDQKQNLNNFLCFLLQKIFSIWPRIHRLKWKSKWKLNLFRLFQVYVKSGLVCGTKGLFGAHTFIVMIPSFLDKKIHSVDRVSCERWVLPDFYERSFSKFFTGAHFCNYYSCIGNWKVQLHHFLSNETQYNFICKNRITGFKPNPQQRKIYDD